MFFYVLVLFIISDCSLLNAQWSTYSLPYHGFAYTLGFYNLNLGISCGHTFAPFNEKIYYTTNSGINWNLANYPQELRAIVGIQFINATTAYACGAENMVFDNNYDAKNDFISYPKNIRERFYREGKREFYSGYKAAFIKSTDAGINWQRVSQFDTTKGYINDIFFFDKNTGYALIDSSFSQNTKFYKTTNSGANWQFIKLIDQNSEVEKMYFFDMNTGIAKGFNDGGRIYKTTNGGINWLTNVMTTQIDGITFFNSTTGIAIGANEGATSTNIYKTTNAGNNWNLISTISGKRLFTNLKSITSTGTAFAVGNLFDTVTVIGKVTTLKTTNYGLDWVPKEFNPMLSVFGMSLVDANIFL